MRKPKRMIVEIERVRKVSNLSEVYETLCAGCNEEVELVTFAEASKIAGTSVDAVIKRAAKGEVHLGLVPEALLVCLNSLLAVQPFNRKAQVH